MRELIRHIIREHTMTISEQRSTKKLTTDEFIENAKKIHGEKYDYSNVNYVNSKTDIEIICPSHGPFNQRPNNHLNGAGCPKCYNRSAKISSNTPKFIEKATKIHGDKYDYSEVNYVSAKTPVKIICPVHGGFLQKPNDHLNGNGCKKCGSRNVPYTTQEYVSAAKEIHGDKYNYSNVDYVNAQTPVEIICKKHGTFLQKPSYHLSGQGCPRCNESKGAALVREILSNNSIPFVEEKRFDDCTNEFEGRYCVKLPFDFYIKTLNTIIEYDGVQHFVPSFGQYSFEITQRNDKLKNSYCERKGIKLIRIPYTMNMEDIEPYILSELGM